MLTRMAQERGVPTPTAAALKQLDRQRKGQRLSNAAGVSPTDPGAQITRMQDRRTRLAYQREHAVDLRKRSWPPRSTPPIRAIRPPCRHARSGSPRPGGGGLHPTIDRPAELIAAKGDHRRAILKDFAAGPGQTRIAAPKPKEVQRWRGDLDARRAVDGNRARLRSGGGKDAFKLRAERVERGCALTLERGGLRRTHRRRRENVQKRSLVHVAGYNLGLGMRLLLGAGTPQELAARGAGLLWLFDPDLALLLILILAPEPGPDPHFVNALLT